MKFNRTSYEAALGDACRQAAKQPDRQFLLRLCPEWHRVVCLEKMLLFGCNLDRVPDGPIRLGVGNVQISQANMDRTHQLTEVEGSVT